MLHDYFNENFSDEERRLLAVQAALIVAQSSASATTAADSSNKVKYDLEHAAVQIKKLADAIQDALEN
ncbi:TPA: hypothetical protein QCH65_000429 [Enterobacter roggenkampii]|nr:hypothetical protein [Enterobacter roggenkampii]